MLPAQEGLGTEAVARLHVDARLVEQRQLVAGDKCWTEAPQQGRNAVLALAEFLKQAAPLAVSAASRGGHQLWSLAGLALRHVRRIPGRIIVSLCCRINALTHPRSSISNLSQESDIISI